MKIKEFCERYNAFTSQSLKDEFIKQNLKITPYIPFVKKDALATNLVNISTYEYENYVDENGNIKRIKSERIKLNSTVQYLLFCRMIIENYTNLEVETEGFFEEYDALKSCGLLDKLMGSDDSILPMNDIAELRTVIDMKQKDVLYNECEIHNYISKQIGMISDLANATLTPLIDVVSKKLNEMPKEDLDKFVEFAKNGNFREV